jgi:AhpD family alkylhydroperoxidase
MQLKGTARVPHRPNYSVLPAQRWDSLSRMKLFCHTPVSWPEPETAGLLARNFFSYRELIQLAVAAHITCDYCVYFHTESAKAYGAADEELKEAVAMGAQTRHWSMILQGAQIELEIFKKEFNQMMNYMDDQADAN